MKKIKFDLVARIISNKEKIWWPALGYKTLIELENKNLINNK